MTWSSIRTQAAAILTPRQLEILDLEAANVSQREIAYRLDISRSTVLDHIDAAQRTLRRHGIHRAPGGNYHLEEPAA